MITDIIFEYKLPAHALIAPHTKIEDYGIDQLRSILQGSIFLFFNPNNRDDRNYLILKTGIIDYILEFDTLLSELEAGATESFTVSCDYFSNSLKYRFDPALDKLTIYESNNGYVRIDCQYASFKSAYLLFRKRVFSDLELLSPIMRANEVFLSLLEKKI